MDIETASEFSSFEEMDSEWKQLWAEKNLKINEEANVSQLYQSRAGVMAEFAKVVCISIGFFESSSELKFKIQSFFGIDEKKLLEEFKSIINELSNKKQKLFFAGHNIREFDIPFLCRRLLINRLSIPDCLNFQHKKPWEINVMDSFQLWRFGDYKNFTSLKLLAKSLSLPSPKSDLDGSMVGALYWEKNPAIRHLNLIRIAEYCNRDVETTMRIILILMNAENSKECKIEIVNRKMID